MRVVSKLVLAGFALAACSTAASAAVDFTSTGLELNAPAGYTTVVNFDSPNAAGYLYTGDTFNNTSSAAAEPAGDNSIYGAAEPGTNAMLTIPGVGVKDISIYIGSVDSYNTITFFDGATELGAVTGSDLTNPANGDQSGDMTNRRYFFTFGGQDVTSVVFNSTQPALEFDNIAIAGVPEPATWAMMILGFGFVGFMMRGNRQKASLAT